MFPPVTVNGYESTTQKMVFPEDSLYNNEDLAFRQFLNYSETYGELARTITIIKKPIQT